MITVDDKPGAVTAWPVAGRLRYAALLSIASGVTPAELRSAPAPTAARKIADNEIADEAERLAAHGVTGRVASRALAEHARLSDRRIAAAMLRQEGPAAVGMCREAAGRSAEKGDLVTRDSVLAFAAAAVQLLAEDGAQ
jgi:hypothetical protein